MNSYNRKNIHRPLIFSNFIKNTQFFFFYWNPFKLMFCFTSPLPFATRYNITDVVGVNRSFQHSSQKRRRLQQDKVVQRSKREQPCLFTSDPPPPCMKNQQIPAILSAISIDFHQQTTLEYQNFC